jgi:hypothetical protein
VSPLEVLDPDVQHDAHELGERRLDQLRSRDALEPHDARRIDVHRVRRFGRALSRDWLSAGLSHRFFFPIGFASSPAWKRQ